MNKKTFFRTFFVGLTVAVMLPTLVLAVVSDVDPDDGGSQCVLLNFNLKYRSRDANTNGEVSTLQDFLQSQNYLSSEPTGYFGILTLKAVKDFQRDNGITPTGYVGPITRAKINALCGDVTSGGGGGGGGGSVPQPPCVNGVCPPKTEPPKPIYGSPVISGISGPQSLKVGEQGTWTVTASDPNNGTLSYSVTWGDEYQYQKPSVQGMYATTPTTSQQSAIFTHTYSQVGTYTPVFTVTNNNGQSAKTSLSVNVGEVTATNRAPVITDNSGDHSTPSGQAVNFYFKATDADNDDLAWGISDWGDGSPGSNSTCREGGSQNGANHNYSTSHTWNNPGKYLVTVFVSDCRGGSDSESFSVYVGDTQSSNFTITTPSPLPNAKVGTPFNTPLTVSGIPTGYNSNSLGWGTSNASLFPPGVYFGAGEGGQQYMNIYGTPTVAGIYTFSITVSAGSQSVSKQFTLTVDPATTVITPTITVISPNGGETLTTGNIQRISWTSTGTSLVNLVNLYIVNGSVNTGSGNTNLIGSSIPTSQGYYDWTIPPVGQLPGGVGGGNFKVRIENANNSTVIDYSNASFSIIAPVTTVPGYRYLKVQSTSNSWIAWHEIQAIDSSGNVLSPVSCTPLASGSYNSSCGDVYPGKGGYWNAGSLSGTITLDYGSDKNITQVKLLPSNSPTLANATHTVSAWADGASEGSATVLKTFSGQIQDQVWLTYQSPIAQSNASQLASILDALKSALASLKKSLQ